MKQKSEARTYAILVLAVMGAVVGVQLVAQNPRDNIVNSAAAQADATRQVAAATQQVAQANIQIAEAIAELAESVKALEGVLADQKERAAMAPGSTRYRPVVQPTPVPQENEVGIAGEEEGAGPGIDPGTEGTDTEAGEDLETGVFELDR